MEEKERIDWERQFCLCKGTDIIEDSVKIELLGEIHEVVEASQQQCEIEKALLASVI